MVNNKLTRPEVQRFIHEHELTDERQLVLKHKEIHGIPASVIAQQIVGRRKAKEKLPSFYNTAGIVYPAALNLEQSSSEQTAIFKTAIINSEINTKKFAADLTGGYGIDAYFLSKIFHRVDYVEPNSSLLEIVQHNYKQLGAINVDFHNTSAENFLNELSGDVELIFIDPSRRTRGNQKVFKLEDCEPDVLKLQDVIYKKTNTLFIKTSPLLDIQQGMKQLKFVAKVFVLSVDNECKEVLFLCKKDFTNEASIVAINIQKETVDSFSFNYSEEQHAKLEYAQPLKFLYEPNASILKAGAFKKIGLQFDLYKLQANTHLYTSNSLIPTFPGRIFEVESLFKSDPGIAHNIFKDGKANVITRNYPLGAEELKKKLKLKDGGNNYLIAGTGPTEKFLCACSRIK